MFANQPEGGKKEGHSHPELRRVRREGEAVTAKILKEEKASLLTARHEIVSAFQRVSWGKGEA